MKWWRVLSLKGALIAGLDGFYRSYIVAAGDNANLEDDAGTITTSLW